MQSFLKAITLASLASSATAWPPASSWSGWDDKNDYPYGPHRSGPGGPSSVRPYQPVQTSCPREPLVRDADCLNPKEARYIERRKEKADRALEAWLNKLGDFNNDDQPTIAFASSGGGLRAFLEAAGVVQSFDGRDGDQGTNGLYQAISYQSGISGGSWFVSTLAGNNWPTITDLKKNLWDTTLQELLPADNASSQASPLYPGIVADVVAKQKAGYTTSIVDPFGRYVAAGILFPENVDILLSSIPGLSNFTSYNAPFPLFTSVGTEAASGQCFPSITNPQYEFNPYEFGSWDSGVQAFTPVKYLGTNVTAGRPTVDNKCTIRYDNLGFTFSASANVWPKFYCFTTFEETPVPLAEGLEQVVLQAHPEHQATDIFALYANPFHGNPASTFVQNDTELYLVDGGFWGSDIPIWPFIQKTRNVDVIIAADISEDTSDSLPNGLEMRLIYDRAQQVGLTKMPFIPTADVYIAQGLNKRATFFGCNQTDTSFIIYLPNVEYTFPSNQSSLRVSYTPADTDGMIANGVLIGTQNNDPAWPFCLACGIKNKDGNDLPDGCDACFAKYCYYQ
ncbi:hypothetical protein AMS68_005941 [Peltaster fructicola]|uniref:Lysophospholipase n=1 Tax=Peltaster fructicola TaxID=286661 RepID=A0A6H0Y0A0_9PEZI|nr:hypothetical protein AMS68_005941 [Peltaster fructicola]